MKLKNVILLLTSLIVVVGLVGCNTQEKKDAADAERLAIIEEKIDELFNEDKTDISLKLEQTQINEIETLLAEEKDNKFSEDNLKEIDSILMYLDLAIDMIAFETEVDQVFDGSGGVLVSAKIEVVEADLMFYENETVFYDRQFIKLTDAKEQLLAIAEVREQIEALFIDGEVKSDVNREQEAEMRELISTLKSADGKQALEASLVKVTALLSSQERAVALALSEQAQVTEKQYETKVETSVAKEQAPVEKVEKLEVVGEDTTEDEVLEEITDEANVEVAPPNEESIEEEIEEAIDEAEEA